MVYVEIEYFIESCEKFFKIAPLCTSRFQIFLLESNKEIAVDQSDAWYVKNFNLLQTITASTEENLPNGVKRKIQVHFEPSKVGFYLAFLDLGSCAEIHRVTAYYLTCQKVNYNTLRFFLQIIFLNLFFNSFNWA